VELKAQVRLNTEMLQNQNKLLEELRYSCANGTKVAPPKLPADTSMPLQTMEQVQQLEQLLLQPAEKQKLVISIFYLFCYFFLHAFYYHACCSNNIVSWYCFSSVLL